IADQVGITERAAQRILADLIADGYVTRTKVGRRNRYKINPRGHLRHPVFRELSIGPLLEVLNSDGQPKRRQKPPSLAASRIDARSHRYVPLRARALPASCGSRVLEPGGVDGV